MMVTTAKMTEMVTTAKMTDRLQQGDAALGAALSHLVDALEVFRTAGRPDLAATVRAAVTAARQAELLRQSEAGSVPGRDPVDWFLD